MHRDVLQHSAEYIQDFLKIEFKRAVSRYLTRVSRNRKKAEEEEGEGDNDFIEADGEKPAKKKKMAPRAKVPPIIRRKQMPISLRIPETIDEWDELEEKLEEDEDYAAWLRRKLQERAPLVGRGTISLSDVLPDSISTEFNFKGGFNKRAFEKSFMFKKVYLRKYLLCMAIKPHIVISLICFTPNCEVYTPSHPDTSC